MKRNEMKRREKQWAIFPNKREEEEENIKS